MQLPIRSASCDVAIAAHMLYHVPDIALAAAELARRRPSGMVAIVTNGRDHLRELDALSGPAVEALTGHAPGRDRSRSAARFLLDDAAALVAPALTVVDVHRTSREIVVTDPAPIVAYVESEESLFEPALQRNQLGRRATRGRRARPRDHRTRRCVRRAQRCRRLDLPGHSLVVIGRVDRGAGGRRD